MQEPVVERKKKKRVVHVTPPVAQLGPVVGTVKPSKFKHIAHPKTGTLDWGHFPEIETQGVTFQAGPIRLVYGAHFGPNRGFGLEHIWEAHFKLTEPNNPLAALDAVAAFLGEIIQSGSVIYYEGGLGNDANKSMLFKTKAGVVIVEMRADSRTQPCFYSIVTAFPGKNPQGYVIGNL